MLKELLRHVIVIAIGKGVTFGSIQLVDSNHTLVDVNAAKGASAEREEPAATRPGSGVGLGG